MKALRYTMGLDIGIASIGWAVLENDDTGTPKKIERLGVRIFDKAEHPKDGASLAAPRRDKRSQRRVTRRRRHRKERIRYLIEQEGIMSAEQMDLLFANGQFRQSVYELRADALDRALSEEEAVRLLIHFAQRRGYKSNSRSEEAKDEKENGKVKQAISENQACMTSNGYRTVGEMLLKDPRFWRINSDGSRVFTVHNTANEYKMTVERSMVLKEIKTIFESQRRFGASWASESLQTKYLSIWEGQRNFDEGPGGDSRYGGNQIENMLGHCTFEPEELRAPKASYTAEYFRLLQTVNNLKITEQGKEPVFLTDEQKKNVISLCMKSAGVKYAQLRKCLGMTEKQFFNSLSYGDKKPEEVEKRSLGLMQFYHTLRTALNKVQKNAIETISKEQIDEISRILICFKNDENRTRELTVCGIPSEFISPILELSTSKAGHLSLKAMRKILPYLEQGMTYDKACSLVYGSHDGRNGIDDRSLTLKLTQCEEIENPVVRRAVSQTIKVINAITREYGAPETVRVELAREMGRNFQDRRDIQKKQEENASANEAIKGQILEYKKIGNPTGLDIVKYKLYRDQDGICLYSGERLELDHLFDAGYVDVDHIIPYSQSFDDSYSNKVLVRSRENRQKGNRIPFVYFGQDNERWNQFETLVNLKVRSYKKRRNLLMTHMDADRAQEFRTRNLVDTQYLSKVVYNLINDHLLFAETGKYKKKTQSVNGAITAEIRKRLGIRKIRENGDLHHAADATVIACVSPFMIERITNYAKRQECSWSSHGYIDYETGEIMTKEAYDEKYAPDFPAPWDGFREELEARLSDDPASRIFGMKLGTYRQDEQIKPVFVSRMPNHKVTGAAHEDTIRSAKLSGATVSKVALTKLKLGKDGEIEGYYNPGSDLLLYNALKKQLEKYQNKAELAFAEPFHKPKSDGTPGPIVNKVKVCGKASTGVSVNGGYAANDSMVRLDVFHVENDGYYYVPVYVADTVRKDLPNRAVVAHKSCDQWKVMKDEDFLFSLYPGDLVSIRSKSGIKMKIAKGGVGEDVILENEGLYYYGSFDSSCGNLDISKHDRSYSAHGVGGKSLQQLIKLEVDILGDIHPVHLPEKRQSFR